MYLIAIAWIYVVLMMAVAEALSSQGSVLGAVVTFVLYGLLPLTLVLYIVGTPGRRRALRKADGQAADAQTSVATVSPSAPDGGGHAAGDAVAAERKET